MPNFFPSDLPQKPDKYWIEAGSLAEKKVFKQLEKLDHKWVILHNNRVLGPGPTKSGKGPKTVIGDVESDFILIHPDYGILFMEVKGGLLSTEDGEWWQETIYGPQRGEIHKLTESPASQSRNAMYQFYKVLKGSVPTKDQPVNNNWHVHSNYCVCFPETPVSSEIKYLSSDTPRKIVIDKIDLLDIEHRLNEIFSYFNKRPLGGPLSRVAIQALKPTKTFNRSEKALRKGKIIEIKREIAFFTEKQVEYLSLIKQNRRLQIHGSAGTGKTILGIERARQLESTGNKVLFVCFNSLLSEWVSKDLEDTEVMVRSFPYLCDELLHMAALTSLVEDMERLGF